LPEDLSTEDLRWPWPAFRLFIPRGLCSTPYKGGTMDADYLDLTFICANDPDACLPKELAQDLFPGLAKCGYKVKNGLLQSCADQKWDSALGSITTNYLKPGSGVEILQWAVPWHNQKLRDIVKESPRSDDFNTALTSKVRALAFNTLLYLSQKPVIHRVEDVVRRGRQEGKNFKPGLSRARFVSEMNERTQYPPPREKHEPTGRHQAPHWVRGMWRNQPYGPRHSIRKLIWIMPYRTGIHQSSEEV